MYRSKEFFYCLSFAVKHNTVSILSYLGRSCSVYEENAGALGSCHSYIIEVIRWIFSPTNAFLRVSTITHLVHLEFWPLKFLKIKSAKTILYKKNYGNILVTHYLRSQPIAKINWTSYTLYVHIQNKLLMSYDIEWVPFIKYYVPTQSNISALWQLAMSY